MKINIYAIRDSKAGAYNQPFYSVNEHTCFRALRDAVSDVDTNFYRHAEDYSCWFIGIYDDSTGSIESKTPEHVLNFIDIKEVLSHA